MKELRGLQPRLKRWRCCAEPPAAQQLISIFFLWLTWCLLYLHSSYHLFSLYLTRLKKNKTKKKPCFNYRSADLSPVRRGDKHREIRTKYRQTQKYKRDVKSLNPPWKTGVSEDTVWRFSVLLIIAGKGSFCLSVLELWRAQKPMRILFLYWCQRQGRASKKCKRSSRVTLSLNPKSTKDTNTDPSYI